jgi:hypothetical protein
VTRRGDAIELTPEQRRLNLIAVTAAMSVTSPIYGLSLPLFSLAMLLGVRYEADASAS